MATMPSHRCHICGSVVAGGRCPTCRQQRDGRRDSAAQRGYCSARWRRLRALKLQHEPLCRACVAAGRLVAADTVDHIRPHTGVDTESFWRWDNLQSLCASCHSRKTATQDSAFARRT